MKKFIDISSLRKEGREKLDLIKEFQEESKMKNYAKGKKVLKWLAIFAGFLVLLKVFFFAAVFLKERINFSTIDSNKFQAVFLTNNQSYFGHILEINNNGVTLDKVYYFKISQNPKSAQQFNLVKLSNEIYGPEDLMHIPENQIIFWQNLRDDSQVARIIKQLEKNQLP